MASHVLESSRLVSAQGPTSKTQKPQDIERDKAKSYVDYKKNHLSERYTDFYHILIQSNIYKFCMYFDKFSFSFIFSVPTHQGVSCGYRQGHVTFNVIAGQ